MKNRVVNRVVFASVLAMILPSFALAASPSQIERLKIRVSYADLNIQSEAGARVLYARVQRASEKACGVASLPELGSVSRVADTRECAEHLIEKAVKQIGSDELTKVHAG